MMSDTVYLIPSNEMVLFTHNSFGVLIVIFVIAFCIGSISYVLIKG